MAMCKAEFNKCSLDGWEVLFDLCPQHFREYRIRPALDTACKADVLLQELNDRLYQVEVASGLRASPAKRGRVKASGHENVVIMEHYREDGRRANRIITPKEDTLEDMD